MIGVCIKYFHENYGGMLQAFATIKMLEERGIDYELIQYEKNRTIVQKIKSIPRLMNSILLNDKYEAFKKSIGKRNHPDFKKNDEIRMEAFDRFRTAEFKKLSPKFKGYKALCEGASRYKAVLTGSDQLWSPAGLPTNFYNLMFVPNNIRKISYASSFGVGKIPWYQKKRTANYLERIEFISMRENRGSKIVKELVGRDVPTVLDPVFNFDKVGWNKLIPEEKIVDQPYIFAYFLGNNELYRQEVEELSRNTKCKIVTLRHLDQYVESDEKFGDIALYDIGPAEFLNLIRFSGFVCTDSFHGACFSIINHKKFMIFNRYSDNSSTSKNSRIESLCNNLVLNDRRYKGDILDIKKEINYVAVDKELINLKKITGKYLDTVFDKLY